MMVGIASSVVDGLEFGVLTGDDTLGDGDKGLDADCLLFPREDRVLKAKETSCAWLKVCMFFGFGVMLHARTSLCLLGATPKPSKTSSFSGPFMDDILENENSFG